MSENESEIVTVIRLSSLTIVRYTEQFVYSGIITMSAASKVIKSTDNFKKIGTISWSFFLR